MMLSKKLSSLLILGFVGSAAHADDAPWASSDVLMTMYYGLTPEQRGLVEQDDLPIFTFPPDYIERLWNAIEAVDPEFAEDYRQHKAVQTAGDKP